MGRPRSYKIASFGPSVIDNLGRVWLWAGRPRRQETGAGEYGRQGLSTQLQRHQGPEGFLGQRLATPRTPSAADTHHRLGHFSH